MTTARLKSAPAPVVPPPVGRSGVAAPGRKRKPVRTGPGRPEGESNLREKILDAAEVAFAELGYAGTTLRVVADAADVTQALISYYFGSKHGLFEAAFLRRGMPISDQRLVNLEELQASGKRIRLRDLVQAFLAPVLALRATPEGRAFLRLQARLHTEPPSISYDLRTRVYDFSTRKYVQALRLALPDLPEQDVFWRMTLMVGAYMYAFSDTHRMEVTAPGLVDLDDTEAILDQITAFVVGGLQAPASIGAIGERPRTRVLKKKSAP
ncbi:TetR/AcrR family transcriptional regulator [Ramlibacter henchirensis]|uniref:TetR/AcrR family transcriptional regulator n=1 Tax=Ramlibacter henchirensis TaxID=204072 RepID=A0A4Z0C1X2_9BURK|nr:TetR/AcrR family transcriptional regulator [Ramlibacter henchirensis]TFZ05526.1 TetR/AcrR family transcriptional regulator [Ramlibacter henchirensis]